MQSKTMSSLLALILAMAAGAAVCAAQSAPRAALPPLPAPLDVPHPGPETAAPYAPQPILPGGIVVPLYPPGSPFLDRKRVREPERYHLSASSPGRIDSIVNIHNPSIEVHTVASGLNTGAAVILIPGGGHITLNVGGEGADFVPFFANYGVNTIILRNRLHSDGYSIGTDATYDVQQAIRLVRAYAAQLRIDPHRIGVMGFSAGGELASNAAVFYERFDKQNSGHGDALAGISSRPDFVALVYPGPTPFAPEHAPAPVVPRDMPPTFLVCAGSDDQIHAMWADQYFHAMLASEVPNLEMHIYGNGRHPGDPLRDGTHMSGGLTDRRDTPYGTWQFRFIDWFRDLGFLQRPGIETKAAKDVDYSAAHPAAKP